MLLLRVWSLLFNCYQFPVTSHLVTSKKPTLFWQNSEDIRWSQKQWKIWRIRTTETRASWGCLHVTPMISFGTPQSGLSFCNFVSRSLRLKVLVGGEFRLWPSVDHNPTCQTGAHDTKILSFTASPQNGKSSIPKKMISINAKKRWR